MNSSIKSIAPTERILSLRRKTLSAERYLSIDQAKIITRVYSEKGDIPAILKEQSRLKDRCLNTSHHRSPGIYCWQQDPRYQGRRGIFRSWNRLARKEIEDLPSRPQDPFGTRPDDVSFFTGKIAPFWKGKTLEDDIYGSYGDGISSIEMVAKINQKDHAQGLSVLMSGNGLRWVQPDSGK